MAQTSALHRSAWALCHNALGLFVMALVVSQIVSCGPKEPIAPEASQVSAEDRPASQSPIPPAQILGGSLAVETPDDTDFDSEARLIMNRYPDLDAQELLNVPEVNTQLTAALRGLGEDAALQKYINSTVDLAAHFKGLKGPPGSYKLNLDVSVYDDTRTRRMLGAVMTGQPRPIVEFLAEELGEASFEFTFTDADKTSNGISLDPANPPPANSPAPD